MNRIAAPLITRLSRARGVFAAALLLALPALAPAIGILLPRESGVSAIRLGDTAVQVDIKQNISKTRVIQEFYNPNPRQLEADFYFPVPKGADVTDFVLYMNGKPTKGEVLEKQKAREIYEGIVRKMQDPGLLEWTDYNLFKVRVFPVPASGTQKIELEFAQPLEADQGTFKYTFPLRAPASALRADTGERRSGDPDVKFTVDLASDEPLRNVYSPSHNVDVDMKDPKAVHVKLAQSSLRAASGDFVLFYEPSKKDMALSVIAQRTSASDDGFFSLMLSPPVRADRGAVPGQDITFVIDTSGSMQEDNRIEQARKALAYCVGQLRPEDRFALIRFSTETEHFQKTLASATKENIDSAKKWISQLEPRGGTNIGDALKEALEMRPAISGPSRKLDTDTTTTQKNLDASADASRVYTIVFVTDGMPTVGQTDPKKIVESLKDEMSKRPPAGLRPVPNSDANIRIFTFGVGNDINTKLLDRIADETRSAAEYIRPGQDMEVLISRFFDKVSQPALTSLKLEIPGADVYDMYPKELPDLFYGTQLTVFGRYKKSGATAIRLAGNVAGKPADFTFEKTLPERETGNDFVEKLWGTRKIAYLLDSIRRSGESSETKDEVIKLAKKYGVVTPYTSYLVADDTQYAMNSTDRRAMPPRATPLPDVMLGDADHASRSLGIYGGPVASSPLGRASGGSTYAYNSAAGTSSRGDVSRPGEARRQAAAGFPGLAAGASGPTAMEVPPPMSSAADLKSESGAGAVAASVRLKALKDAKVANESIAGDKAALRSAGGRSFVLSGGVWVDSDIKNASETPKLKIKYMSQAWFDATNANPALKEIFALGERVRVKLPGGIVEVGLEGKETLEPAEQSLLKG